MDNTKLLEKIIYDGERFKYEKETMYASNFGFKDNIALGGKKNDIVLNTIYYPLNHENLKLFYPVKNPEVYKLENSFWRDNPWYELIIFGRYNGVNNVQLLSVQEDPYVLSLELPQYLKSANLTNVVYFDNVDPLYLGGNQLLGFYEKEKNTFIVYVSNSDIEPVIYTIGRLNTKIKNTKYIYLINKGLYQIGGIKTKTPFNCGDIIQDDMEISGAVNFIE